MSGWEMGEEKEKEKSKAHGDADVGDLRQETNGAQTLKPKPKPRLKLQGLTPRRDSPRLRHDVLPLAASLPEARPTWGSH